MDDDYDGSPFPVGSEVWVRFPGTVAEEKGPRDDWPWLAGVITERCGPDEWECVVMAREVAMTEDGSPAPVATAEDDLWHPACFRNASELRTQDQDVTGRKELCDENEPEPEPEPAEVLQGPC